MFSRHALPAVTAHEVAPGHFAHGRALRRAPGEVRQSLFGSPSPRGGRTTARNSCSRWVSATEIARYQIGVALEALVRLTPAVVRDRTAHRRMTVETTGRSFQSTGVAVPSRSPVRSAGRGTFDPAYGMYTWGKWLILDAREAAKAAWGSVVLLASLPRRACSSWALRRLDWCAAIRRSNGRARSAARSRWRPGMQPR